VGIFVTSAKCHTVHTAKHPSTFCPLYGYGIRFRVELSAAQRTARAWDDADPDDENAVPTGAGQFNPEDLEGLSIH
jgi:hypothetical protein